jgi:hypothetical protein
MFPLSNTSHRRRRRAVAAAGLAVGMMLPLVLAVTPADAATGGAGGGARHHQAAIASAHRRLHDVLVPKGAQSSTTPPEGSGTWLTKPAEWPATPNLVDDKAFYVVKGQAQKVLRWFETHRPTGSKLTGTGVISTRGTVNLWMAEFSWPGVHNVLFSEEVVIAAVRLPGDSAAIRIDSQATWLPGVYPCPPGPDLDIYVEFRQHRPSAPDAVATAYPYGCTFVSMEVHGQTSPQTLVDGGVLAGQLKRLVGLKLPPVPPGIHPGGGPAPAMEPRTLHSIAGARVTSM